MENAEKRARKGKLQLLVTQMRWTNRDVYSLFIHWSMEQRGPNDRRKPSERHQEALRADAVANGKDPGRITSKEAFVCSRAPGQLVKIWYCKVDRALSQASAMQLASLANMDSLSFLAQPGRP